jgi:hypothetical protein
MIGTVSFGTTSYEISNAVEGGTKSDPLNSEDSALQDFLGSAIAAYQGIITGKQMNKQSEGLEKDLKNEGIEPVSNAI